jgi:hypothetical protein
MERIVVLEGLDESDIPVRERVPANDARALEALPFAGCDPFGGAYEDDIGRATAEYLPPRRRAS